MTADRRFLHRVRDLVHGLEGDVSLESIARRAGVSRFRFHRAFKRLSGETPKQYTLRLRLERAAGDLLATRKSVATIARHRGFASHDGFTRAFQRRFGVSPSQFRLRTLAGASRPARLRQRELMNAIGPCIRLHHFPLDTQPRRSSMSLLSVTRKDIAPQPFLFIRRQASQRETSNTLAECFGTVYSHCMAAGLELAGFPLARYPVVGPLMTIEAGVPLVKPAAPTGEMEYCELPGGPVVFAVHGGPYDQLGETHAAVLRWIQAEGLQASGPHWEWYVTDPGEHPDPADWRTHIYYPLAK